MESIFIQLIITITNIFLAFWGYHFRHYKTAMFSMFVSGVAFVVLLEIIKEYGS